jgi:DNA-directed RNA polymerase specialized sigma24 family protein
LLDRKADELPKNYRTVFVLRSVQELDIEETAKTPGFRRKRSEAVTPRLRHAARIIEARLNFVEPDLFDFGGNHCDRPVAIVFARM